MSKIYLPDSIYERLPVLYIFLALLLIVTSLGPIKWLLIAALVVATMVVRRQRQAYRRAQRLRESNAIMEKYQLSNSSFN